MKPIVLVFVLASILYLFSSVNSQSARVDLNWGYNNTNTVQNNTILVDSNSTGTTYYLFWTLTDDGPHDLVSTNTISGNFDASQVVPPNTLGGNPSNAIPFYSGTLTGTGTSFFIRLVLGSIPNGAYYYRDSFNSSITGVIYLEAPPSATASLSISSSVSGSISVSRSLSGSVSLSSSASLSISNSGSLSVSASLSGSTSISTSLTSSVSTTASVSPSLNPTVTPTISLSASSSPPPPSTSSSVSTSLSQSGSISLTISITPSISGTISVTPSPSPSLSCGVCGCGVSAKDTDGDGVPDCIDLCPYNRRKTSPSGKYGCDNGPRSTHTYIEFDFNVLAEGACPGDFNANATLPSGY